MDGDAHVGHVVDKLGVEGEFRFSLGNHTGQIVVPVAHRRAADLVVGIDVTVQKELHRRAGVEPDEEIPRPGEDEGKGVDPAEGKIRHHPVHLSDLGRQEDEFVECLPSLLPVLLREAAEEPVAAPVPIRLETLHYLGGLQGGVSLVPLPDEPGKGLEIGRRVGAPLCLPAFNDTGDGLVAHMKQVCDLPAAQMLHLEEMLYLAYF